jgi:DNA-directed RNA polymerase subunit RPC12/RpoP
MTTRPDHACTVCGAEFITAELLREHEEGAHVAPDEDLRCHLCGAEPKDRLEYDQHMAEAHRGETLEQFPCPDCGLRFPTPAILRSTSPAATRAGWDSATSPSRR